MKWYYWLALFYILGWLFHFLLWGPIISPAWRSLKEKGMLKSNAAMQMQNPEVWWAVIGLAWFIIWPFLMTRAKVGVEVKVDGGEGGNGEE